MGIKAQVPPSDRPVAVSVPSPGSRLRLQNNAKLMSVPTGMATCHSCLLGIRAATPAVLPREAVACCFEKAGALFLWGPQ
jgi:hypothetical protein